MFLWFTGFFFFFWYARCIIDSPALLPLPTLTSISLIWSHSIKWLGQKHIHVIFIISAFRMCNHRGRNTWIRDRVNCWSCNSSEDRALLTSNHLYHNPLLTPTGGRGCSEQSTELLSKISGQFLSIRPAWSLSPISYLCSYLVSA